MGLTANVVADELIESAWGNEIRDRTTQVFASVAERDAQWTSPPNGAVAFTVADSATWRRIAGVWRRLDQWLPRYGGSPIMGTDATSDPLVFTSNKQLIATNASGEATIMTASSISDGGGAVVAAFLCGGDIYGLIGAFRQGGAGELIVKIWNGTTLAASTSSVCCWTIITA